MSDKIKLLEAANKKVADNSEFIAYYLLKYSKIENFSQQDIISILKCSAEDYFKLGLCKAPKIDSSNFIDELNKVSDYTHVSTIELNNIIKRVATLEKFSQLNNNSILMAARDKGKDKNKNENE